MAIKLNIGDPKSKRTYTVELDEQASHKLYGKKLGQSFKGELIDKPGYEFLITGGSDNSGFPMRNDLDGERRQKVLLTHGVGNRAMRKGMRLRKTVSGSTASAITAQLNLKVTKNGAKPLVEAPAPAEKAGE